MSEKNLTQNYLRSILRYDPKTGFLFWKVKRKAMNIGDRAGCLNKQLGYVRVTIKNKLYSAHRIIWIMHYDEIPDQIDHINHVKHDNRIENLRSVTLQENLKNQKVKSRNKSGVSGVHWNRGRKRWYVNIGVSGKQTFLGAYANLLDAVSVRKSAEIAYNYHPNHGSPRTN